MYARDNEKNNSSSIISIIYRNYFIKNRPSIRSFSNIHPYIALCPSLLYLKHEDFIPGFEIQIGSDLLYKNWIHRD